MIMWYLLNYQKNEWLVIMHCYSYCYYNVICTTDTVSVNEHNFLQNKLIIVLQLQYY